MPVMATKSRQASSSGGHEGKGDALERDLLLAGHHVQSDVFDEHGQAAVFEERGVGVAVVGHADVDSEDCALSGRNGFAELGER